MEYDATMVLRNSFFTLRLTNHDDPREQVEKDAEQIADRLGASYLYLETVGGETAS